MGSPTSSPLSSALSSLSSPSSPLSSLGSRSPTPPVDYPSPPSSNVSDMGASKRSRDEALNFDRDATISEPDRDEQPPAKRQRIMKPRELKTEYLNLTMLNESDNGAMHQREDSKVQKLMEVLRNKKKIVVIAGAGISVSAGGKNFSLSHF
jgi:NAD-dependent histone deacetylase SIR2